MPIPIDRVVTPTDWPVPPGCMSFSALHEIEGCPRAWALLRARYTDEDGAPGYPRIPSMRALEGSAVHEAAARVVKAVSNAGCTSMANPEAVAAIRELGGFTCVLEECLRAEVESLSTNPRVTRHLAGVERKLAARLPELRSSLQMLVASLSLVTHVHGGGEERARGGLETLRNGSYPEQRVQSNAMQWMGVVDLLVLDDHECVLVDFKSGEPREEHGHQLLAYAAIWANDEVRNPGGRLATFLSLVYTSGEVRVQAPGSAEVSAISAELRSRAEVARRVLALRPPPATPEVARCGWCQVRHLCDEYWHGCTVWAQGSIGEGLRRFVDVEIAFQHFDGDSYLAGRVSRSADFASGDSILFRTKNAIPEAARQGSLLRVLGAKVVADAAEGTRTLSETNETEVFVV